MSRKPRADGASPYWASLLGRESFREFMAGVQGYFGKRAIKIEIDAEQGVVRPIEGVYATSSGFGLVNLLQSCAQTQSQKWPGMIQAHFDSILTAPTSENALMLDVTDFAKIKSMLRARIYPDDVTNYFAELVSRPGPPGTLEVLVPMVYRASAKARITRCATAPLSIRRVARGWER